jgi:hypothetical protein
MRTVEDAENLKKIVFSRLECTRKFRELGLDNLTPTKTCSIKELRDRKLHERI